MIKKILNHKNKYNYSVLLLLTLWIGIWISIGGEFKNIIFLYEKNLSIPVILDGIRGLLPILIFVVCIFFIIINRKKIKLNKRPGLIFELYILYVILQIVGLLASGAYNPEGFESTFAIKVSNSVKSIYWLVALMCPILIFFILKKLNLNKFIYLFFIASIIILSCSFSIYFIKIFLSFWTNDSPMYGRFPDGIIVNIISANSPPRTSGLARQGLIIYICLIFCMFYYRNNKNDKLIFPILFLITMLFSTAFFLLQSRLVILIYLFANFLIFFLNKRLSFIEKINFYLLYLFVPIFIAFLVSDLRPGDKLSAYWLFDKHYERNEVNEEWFEDLNNILESVDIVEVEGEDEIAPLGNDSKLLLRVAAFRHSGRLAIWKDLFKAGSEKTLTGWGPQADRYLYNQGYLSSKYELTLSASNALLYAFLCGGLFATLILLSICFYSFYSFVLVIAKGRILSLNKKITLNSAAIIIFCILMRSVFETAHAVFSIDYLIFFVSFLILYEEIGKNKIYSKSYLKSFLFSTNTSKGI